MKTFSCEFGDGVSCKIECSDFPPEKGTSHILKVEWTDRPNKSCVRPYIAWMNSVNQTLSDEWNVTLMHVFQTGKNWMSAEVWIYRPGSRPKLDKKI